MSEIELFDHLTVCKEIEFNWIVSDTQQYLKTLNCRQMNN